MEKQKIKIYFLIVFNSVKIVLYNSADNEKIIIKRTKVKYQCGPMLYFGI